MALLRSNTLPLHSTASSSPTAAFSAHHPNSFVGYRTLASPFLKDQFALIVKALSVVDGSAEPEPTNSSESHVETIPVQNLPFESKLDLKLEQKVRMKLAKKMRLRRKRLVMKRQLRKKGRWPPSKLKKNKNV